jgi:hypothetical protein
MHHLSPLAGFKHQIFCVALHNLTICNKFSK